MRPRTVLAVLVTALVVLLAGGGALVLVGPPSSEPEPAAPPVEQAASPASGDAAARPYPVLPERERDAEGPAEPPGEDADPEPEEEGFEAVAPGFVQRATGWAPAMPERTEHRTGDPWPPSVVAPLPPEHGHPERTSSRLHHRPYETGREDHPARLLVRTFAAESGEPLPDATVEVLQSGPRPNAQALPDADAHAHTFEPLAAGPLDVRVRRPGRVPWRETTLVAAAGRDVVLDVHMERGQVVEGVVRGIGEVPLEGVRIRLWPADAWWSAYPFGDPPLTLLEAISDAHGAWRIDSAPRLTRLVMGLVGGPGLASGPVHVETGPEVAQPLWQELHVAPGYTATGRITNVHGQPVEGAFVFAREEEFRGPWDTSQLVDLTEEERAEVVLNYEVLRMAGVRREILWVGHRATTDADGAFEIPGLASDYTFRVFAQHPEHGRSAPSEPQAAAALEPYEASLRGMCRVLAVVSSPDGPVADAQISQPWSTDARDLPAREPGVYGPVRAEAGPHVVVARHPEHPLQAYAGPMHHGIENRVTLTLPPGHVVEGRVLTRNERYVEGAVVTVDERTTTTGSKGEFELRGVGAGTTTLRIEKEGLAPLEKEIGVPGAALDLRMWPLAVVKMHLIVPRGADDPPWVEAIAVTRSEWSRGWKTGIPSEPVVSLDWDDGRVEVRAVRNESGWVLVHAPGYTLVRRDLRPRLGEEIDLGRIDLVPARVLTGAVRGEGQGALPGARVVLTFEVGYWDHPPVREHLVRTDADGTFRLPVPWAAGDGSGEVRVIADGFVAEEIEIDPDDTDSTAQRLEIDLVRGHVIRGTVVDADGAPVAAAWVGASRALSAYTDSAGRFAFRVRNLPIALRAARDDEDLGLGVSRRSWWRQYQYVRRLFGRGPPPDFPHGSAEVTERMLEAGDVRIVLRPPE